MHTTPSLTFTAFAVLLMTSTVGNTETGRITGQFGNERLELRIEDGDPLSDVGLDFRQTRRASVLILTFSFLQKPVMATPASSCFWNSRQRGTPPAIRWMVRR